MPERDYSDEPERQGGCACGTVRFVTRGEPKRGGLCHCLTCRKAHASAFNPFFVFDPAQVVVTGETRSWQSKPGYDRRFCPACGSRVFAASDGEYELSLGSFDETAQFAPQYECWTFRREPWQPVLPIPQYEKNRFD